METDIEKIKQEVAQQQNMELKSDLSKSMSLNGMVKGNSRKYFILFGAPILALILIVLLGLLFIRFNQDEGRLTTSQSQKLVNLPPLPSQGDVEGSLGINIPTTYEDTLVVKGLATFEGGIVSPGIITSLTTGAGLASTGGQDPIISNTGVLSLAGESGAVELIAGSGIAIDGLTISSTVSSGSDQNLFRTITTGGTSFEASSPTDTLTFTAGDGISISSNTASKTLTISNISTLELLGSVDGDGSTSSFSGLEYAGANSDELALLQGCANGELLKWNSTDGIWECGSDVGGLSSAVVNVQEGDVTVSATADTLDFSATDFSLTESPSGEINIVLDYASSLITRSNQNEVISGSWEFDAVDVTNGLTVSGGNLNLATGNVYQINGTTVLNANTLGTGITSSSLTSVGALSSGSIASGFGTIATANTITGTTINGTTGINTGAGAGTIRINSSGNLVNIGTTQFNNVTYTWPGSDAASSGYVLTSDGSGGLAWQEVSGIGGVGDITAIGDVSTGAAFTTGGSGSSLFFHDSGFEAELTVATLTGNQSYTLPDSSGTFCLTSGNCSGTGAGIGGSGTTNFVSKFSAQYALTDSSIFDDGNVGIGTTTPLHKLSIAGTSNTTGLATFGAGINVNGETITDFTGSGLSLNSGSLETTLGTSVDLTSEITGVLSLANGGTNKNLTAVNGGIVWSDSDSFEILAAGSTGQILTSGGAGTPSWTDASSLNFWQRNSGALAPLNITDDLLIGGNATSSALIILSGTTGNIVQTSSVTTGNANAITGSSLTSGTILSLTGPNSGSGMVGNIFSATSHIGNDGELINLVGNTAASLGNGANITSTLTNSASLNSRNIDLSSTNSSSAVALIMGIRNIVTDAQSFGNFVYGSYTSLNVTGDTSGAKLVVGEDIVITNDNTTTNQGTRTTYGSRINLTGSSRGASTLYGIHITAASADTNYAIYSAGGTNYFNGNVGIGITNPAAKLVVAGSANTEQFLIRANGTQTPANPLFQLQNSSGAELLSLHSDSNTNVFLGYLSGVSNNVAGNGSWNTFVGSLSGGNNSTGSANTAIGYQSMVNNTIGLHNTAVGYGSLLSNTTGGHNSALGLFALLNNTTGVSNTAVGRSALGLNTTGNFNLSMGGNSLVSNTTGSNNVGLGYGAGSNTQTGFNNTIVGYEAGYGVSSNSYANNSLFGYRAGYGLSTGSNNLLFGYQSGDNITTGANNIIIGYDIDAGSATGSNQLNIGNTIYGDTSTGNVGIGTSSVGSYKLNVSGDSSFNGHIIPSADDTYDLGSDTNRWRDLYLGPATLHVGTSTSDEFTISYDTTSNYLGFNVNGTGDSEIVFDTNGNIGIGVTNPTQALDIDGNINVSGTLITGTGLTVAGTTTFGGQSYDWSGASPANGYILTTDASGALSWIDPGTLPSSNYFQTANGAIAPLNISNDLLLGGNATTSATIRLPGLTNEHAWFNLGTGNVGIGNTSPTNAKLDVTGSGYFSQDLTLAGGDLFLTGQSSSASTTEGSIYYDTDDDQLKVYANGKWQADRSTATVIVAASDSQNKEKADFVADGSGGTDDATTIESAISAVPSTGGTVVLLDGTYNLDSTLDLVKSNTTIIGQGNSTILLRNFDEASANTSGVITVGNGSTAVTNITIAKLRINGNRASYTNSNNHGILLKNNISYSNFTDLTIKFNSGEGIKAINGSTTRTDYISLTDSDVSENTRDGLLLGIYNSFWTVENNIMQRNTLDGINLASVGTNASSSAFMNNKLNFNTSDGIELIGTQHNTISGNTMTTNGQYGIYFSSSVENTSVTGNTSRQNQSGIRLHTGSNYNTVSSNTFSLNSQYGIYVTSSGSNNTLSGNTTASNTLSGIYAGTNQNTYIGNQSVGNGNYGINIAGASNQVSGNYVASNVQYGIYIGNSNNIISDNTLYDNGGSTYSSIIVPSNYDNNIISNNNITDTAGGSTYAIHIANPAADNTVLSNNTFSGTGATTISDTGTGTIYNNQKTNSTGNITFTPTGSFGIGTTSPIGKLNLSGAATGKALAIFDETGNQDIFSASASGTTRFSLNRSGNITSKIDASSILDWSVFEGTDAEAHMGIRFDYSGTGNSGNTFNIMDFEGTDTAVFTIDRGGNVGIGDTTPGSKLSINSLGTGTGTALVIDGNGDVWQDSSSARYKDNIQSLNADYSKLLDLDPKSYTLKSNGMSDIGFIAEDLHAMGLTDLVIYDSLGRPDAIKYNRIPTYLVGILKEQNNELLGLKNSVSNSGSSASQFQASLEQLKQSLEQEKSTISNLHDRIEAIEGLELINLSRLGSATESAVIGDNLLVLGTTTLREASVMEALAVGTTLQITPSSINTLELPLEIQPMKQAPVSIMADAIRIETDGTVHFSENVAFAKDVDVKGEFTTQSISVPKTSLTIQSDTEVYASTSAGTTFIKAGQTIRTVIVPQLKVDALVYITPLSDTQGLTPYVTEQKQANGSESASFTVKLPSTIGHDLPFNFFIINQKEQVTSLDQ